MQRSAVSLPPLRALSAFEAVARNMSFAKAAKELNVTSSAVSQQIKILEEHLAISLFRRLNRRVLLTEAGELYYASVSAAFRTIGEATERVDSNASPRLLVVRSAPSFAAKWLMPRLGDFLLRNPDIDLRLDASNEKTDFVREAVDLEIRFGGEVWGNLHVEPLFCEPFVPLAAPSLVRKYEIKSADDLLALGLPLIHSVKCPVDWQEWFAAQGVETPSWLRGPRFDRSFMSIQAAVDGLGVALESCVMASAEITGGSLVCVVPNPPSFLRRLYWFVCPPANLKRETVERFRHWLFSQPEMQGRELEESP